MSFSAPGSPGPRGTSRPAPLGRMVSPKDSPLSSTYSPSRGARQSPSLASIASPQRRFQTTPEPKARVVRTQASRGGQRKERRTTSVSQSLSEKLSRSPSSRLSNLSQRTAVRPRPMIPNGISDTHKQGGGMYVERAADTFQTSSRGGNTVSKHDHDRVVAMRRVRVNRKAQHHEKRAQMCKEREAHDSQKDNSRISSLKRQKGSYLERLAARADD
ncbi:hypothetical protein KIPB_007786 [Kipferlia bialata]|uniref:Uncharacterized protein n=1 Tax=Kipferlia bialata TaxID=797122 RepID=A0A391NX88_9EUKA|nr:hypothetical protein KIPB_007786 [Kipferlia bialata]|eukprot:g7786.t1